MIRAIALIAAREFRQIAASRGFWITLLIVPILLAAGPIASRARGPAPVRSVMLIDPAGQETAAIARALSHAEPGEPRFRLVPAPPEIATARPAALDRQLPGSLEAEHLDYALYVSPTFTNGAPVRLWTAGPSPDALIDRIEDALADDLRTAHLVRHGLAPAAAHDALRITPDIRVTAPSALHARSGAMIRSAAPLFIAYILFMSLMLSGSWMLQGLVEERSNKLIESLLACVSPSELLFGKLAGTAVIGITMAAAWLGCALIAGLATTGPLAQAIRPALAALASPGTILTIGYFFVAGYLVVAMIFLTIGAVSDSFRDAQSYLGPVMMVIVIPFALVASTLLTSPDATIVRVMSWIPIYAPFVMLARTGTGVPLWELLGSATLLALFVAAELALLDRIFRTSLLAAGTHPGIGRLLARLRRG